MAEDAKAIIDLAVGAAVPRPLDADAVYSIVVPEDAEHKVVDLESFLAVPRRKRGVVRLHNPASLSAYVVRHDAKDGTAALFADLDAARIVGVLNGPSDEAPGWGDHRAELTLRQTPAWKRWMSRNGIIDSQAKFAEHIEDGLAEIAEPPGADLLELAQNFQATTKAAFRSARHLNNGQRQLVYEETIDAKAGEKGQITIPAEFLIVVAPFEGSEVQTIAARLRYRLRDGNLAIGYVLDHPEVVIRSAFSDVLAKVESATALAAYHGTPAS